MRQLLVLEVLACEPYVLLMPFAVPSSSGSEANLSLIGAVNEACYVPCFRGRLVPGHCLIVPAEHVASTRQVDEHVWTEIRNFKKCLLQMFMAQVRPSPLRALPAESDQTAPLASQLQCRHLSAIGTCVWSLLHHLNQRPGSQIAQLYSATRSSSC